MGFAASQSERPHVRLLVTAGGLSHNGEWRTTTHPGFLVPQAALAKIFRAKLCAGLQRVGLWAQVPHQLWGKGWVVHCRSAPQGEQALAYLARYVFRVAITNSRLERFAEGQVTFRYRDNRSQQLQRVTLTAEEFIRRFLLHTLPRSFAKVRYYGLFSPAARAQLAHARTLWPAAAQPPPSTSETGYSVASSTLPGVPNNTIARCPFCQLGPLRFVCLLPPLRKVPP